MASDLILPNCESPPGPRPPDTGATNFASSPAHPYADLLLDLGTPCAEEWGGADPSPQAALALVFPECTDCNGLDENFLDQFTDLDKILNMDTSHFSSADYQEGNLFLPDTATPTSPSSSSPLSTGDAPWTSDLAMTLLEGVSGTLCPSSEQEQVLMPIICSRVDDVTPTTPPITPLPSTTATTPSSASPLSLLYSTLSPNGSLHQDEDNASPSDNPPPAKRPRNTTSDGAGKKDAKYAERRQKNNEASKVSRRKRKERYQELAAREEQLKEENARLRRQVEEMVNETSVLKALLVKRLTIQRPV